MHQHEHFGAGAVLRQRADNGPVAHDIGGEFPTLNVENEDQDGHGAENVGALVGQVVFHKSVLAATIPQVEH